MHPMVRHSGRRVLKSGTHKEQSIWVPPPKIGGALSQKAQILIMCHCSNRVATGEGRSLSSPRHLAASVYPRATQREAGTSLHPSHTATSSAPDNFALGVLLSNLHITTGKAKIHSRQSQLRK
jgi:hypothetical protein